MTNCNNNSKQLLNWVSDLDAHKIKEAYSYEEMLTGVLTEWIIDEINRVFVDCVEVHDDYEKLTSDAMVVIYQIIENRFLLQAMTHRSTQKLKLRPKFFYHLVKNL